MSKLPEHLEPIKDFSFYGVKLKDMNREDLLKVISWLVDSMNQYKKEAENTSGRFSDYVKSQHHIK